MDSAGKSSPDLNRDPVAGYRANGVRQASVPVQRPPPLAARSLGDSFGDTSVWSADGMSAKRRKIR